MDQNIYITGFVLVGLLCLIGIAGLVGLLQGATGRKSKGEIGEDLVSTTLRQRLDGSAYRVFDDLYLPRADGRGTTQVDHVVVSKFGVFVIETKNYTGWIFGREKDRQWTQQIYKHRYRFQNPLHQNLLHVAAVSRYLGLEREMIHPLVYFAGSSEFKTPLPENVIDQGLVSYFDRFEAVLLGEERVEAVCLVLADLDARLDRMQVGREHVAGLRELHGR